MAFKFVVFAAFVAVARAGAIGYGAAPLGVAAYSAAPAVSYSSLSTPLVSHSYAAPALAAYAAPVAKTIIAQPEAPANYDFGYSVNDPHTGDSKTQQESRHGDVVQGSYSLIEADGSKRVVEYSADAHNGFNAVVHREPAAVAVKAVAAPLVAKYAAPAVAAYSSPLVAKYSAAPAVATSYSSLASPVVAKLGAPALAYSSPVHSYYH